MFPRRGWSGGALAAGLALLALPCAQGCVSVSPWRTCVPPCGGAQIERAARVEVCKTDGVPILLTHARWGEDQDGAYIAGKARTQPGEDLGDVRIYADQIQLVRTRRVEAGRVATNAALVPLALVAQAVTEVDFLDDEPEEPEVPECPAAEADLPGPESAPAPAPPAPR
jgi:hypothetical protein